MVLKDVCRAEAEYGYTASGLEKGKYRFARITDIDPLGCLKRKRKRYVNSGEDKMLVPNDLVIARTGTEAGKAYFYNPSDGDLVYGSFLICFHLDDTKINPWFLRYYTISDSYKQWAKKNSSGSTRNGLSIEDLYRMPIPSRSRKEQDKIVANLDCLFLSIRAGEQMIEELSAYAQDVYDYMAPRLHEKGKMRDLIHLRTGNVQRKEGGTIPLYNSGGITGYSYPATYREESILIPNSGTLRNLFYTRKPFCAGTTIFYTELKKPDMGLYVYYSLKQHDLQKLDAGSVIPGINSDTIYNLNCYIPDTIWLQEFNSIVYPIYDKIDVVKEKIKETKQMIRVMLRYYFG